MTFGSLFTGIGGLDLGLERAGMTCRWQVEIDPFCRRALTKHWPGVPKHGDIREITGAELERVDLIAGGFPCQDLSQAGKRAGIEGSRSGLWFEFARLIGTLRPRWVLIENVPGLLVPGAMSRVVGELARLGYVGIWRCLRASEFGAAHIRKRVFIVAYANDGRSHARWAEFGASDSNRTPNHIGRQGAELAHGTTRGRRELRESSGRGGLPDGSGEVMADGERPRCDGSERGGLYANGSPLQAARLGVGGGRMADTGCAGSGRTTEPAGVNRQRPSGDDSGASGALADASDGLLPQPRRGSQGRNGAGSAGATLPDAGGTRLPDAEQAELRGSGREYEGRAVAELRGAPLPFAPGPADERWPAILADYPDLAPSLESPVRGVVDGLPGWLVEAMSERTKRLGKLGNAVVPACGEWIGRRIMEAASP